MPEPSFATAEELREFIGGAQIATARAQTLVDYASAIVRRWTDQTLSAVTADVETFNATSNDILILSERPVTAITEILIEGQPFTEFTFSSVGAIRKTNGLAWDKGAQVTYDHGHAATSDAIQAIRSITLQVAARAFTMAKAPEFDEFSRTVSESAGFAPDVIIWPAEKQLLADFAPSLVA